MDLHFWWPPAQIPDHSICSTCAAAGAMGFITDSHAQCWCGEISGHTSWFGRKAWRRRHRREVTLDREHRAQM